jgi:hypothetical protein
VPGDVNVWMLVCMCACGRADAFGGQVPMVGKGVVESLMATLAAVQGEGEEALKVQEAACETFWNLSASAENDVRLRV